METKKNPSKSDVFKALNRGKIDKVPHQPEKERRPWESYEHRVADVPNKCQEIENINSEYHPMVVIRDLPYSGNYLSAVSGTDPKYPQFYKQPYIIISKIGTNLKKDQNFHGNRKSVRRYFFNDENYYDDIKKYARNYERLLAFIKNVPEMDEGGCK